MEIIQKQTKLDIYVFILNYVFVDFAKPPNDEYILFNTIIYANIIQSIKLYKICIISIASIIIYGLRFTLKIINL
jgi:hypothetical protein